MNIIELNRTELDNSTELNWTELNDSLEKHEWDQTELNWTEQLNWTELNWTIELIVQFNSVLFHNVPKKIGVKRENAHLVGEISTCIYL